MELVQRMARLALQNRVRCELYKKLMDEYCPKQPKYPSSLYYRDAMAHIQAGHADDARFYVAHAGVPQELIVAVDLLVKSDC